MPRRKAKLPSTNPLPPPAPKTVWQSLNEPVVEVSPGFAKNLFLVAVIFLSVAWFAPYWGSGSVVSSKLGIPNLHYNPTTFGKVAGMQTIAPTWYYTLRDLPYNLALAVGQAATQVLDISQSVEQISQVYSPSLDAFRNAWLELMSDPY